ncbi:hypothetical protein ED92_23860 [Amycolatopsis sp. MJM2582]|uniref:hypothetical protein n=1 Tax=Amycolatopsis sp. MJM2582 TaxID=1427749 RepID=UPI00050389AD|nr:hypothetical protein [Amycolatopsis sp. MJM2582]KFZ80394.1 hypothetical protein ED92_23860 [Amycolatopsis sp. MJM2582]
MIPYQLLPIEMHVEMAGAEAKKVPALLEAATMWTEVRGWIDTTAAELSTRVGELSPEWTDDAGRQHEEKAQRTLAELKFWGDRIDAAKPAERLTSLASHVSVTAAEVAGFYAAYRIATLTPFGALEAFGLQQASGMKMTELGGNFDTSMLSVCAAAGIESPADLVPGQETVSAEGNSPTDFLAAAEAGMTALTELQSLAETASSFGGGSGSELPATDGLSGQNGSSGISLAGLAPLPSGAGSLPSLGGLPGGLPGGSGLPPMPSGLLGGLGAAGGLGGLPGAAKPVAGKRAPSLASEIQPGAATPAGAKSAGTGVPPMMSPHGGGGQATAGTLRPGSSDQPTGRNGSSRRAASGGSDGVPVKLRGRAASGNPDSGFTLAQGRQPAESESGSVQLLDEDLWWTNPR